MPRLRHLLARRLAPGLGLLTARRFGECYEPLRRAGLSRQHDILAGLAQLRRNLGVNRQRTGVDDPHIHAGFDGMVEEDRVHGFAQKIVATERERQVRHAARHMGVGQSRADLRRRLDEVEAISVVRLDAGCHGENIRIEDDVFRREADNFRQDTVGARADLDLALFRVRLALFVESHDDDRRAVAPHDLRVRDEGRLALLQ